MGGPELPAVLAEGLPAVPDLRSLKLHIERRANGPHPEQPGAREVQNWRNTYYAALVPGISHLTCLQDLDMHGTPSDFAVLPARTSFDLGTGDPRHMPPDVLFCTVHGHGHACLSVCSRRALQAESAGACMLLCVLMTCMHNLPSGLATAKMFCRLGSGNTGLAVPRNSAQGHVGGDQCDSEALQGFASCSSSLEAPVHISNCLPLQRRRCACSAARCNALSAVSISGLSSAEQGGARGR